MRTKILRYGILCMTLLLILTACEKKPDAEMLIADAFYALPTSFDVSIRIGDCYEARGSYAVSGNAVHCISGVKSQGNSGFSFAERYVDNGTRTLYIMNEEQYGAWIKVPMVDMDRNRDDVFLSLLGVADRIGDSFSTYLAGQPEVSENKVVVDGMDNYVVRASLSDALFQETEFEGLIKAEVCIYITVDGHEMSYMTADLSGSDFTQLISGTELLSADALVEIIPGNNAAQFSEIPRYVVEAAVDEQFVEANPIEPEDRELPEVIESLAGISFLEGYYYDNGVYSASLPSTYTGCSWSQMDSFGNTLSSYDAQTNIYTGPDGMIYPDYYADWHDPNTQETLVILGEIEPSEPNVSGNIYAQSYDDISSVENVYSYTLRQIYNALTGLNKDAYPASFLSEAPEDSPLSEALDEYFNNRCLKEILEDAENWDSLDVYHRAAISLISEKYGLYITEVNGVKVSLKDVVIIAGMPEEEMQELLICYYTGDYEFEGIK